MSKPSTINNPNNAPADAPATAFILFRLINLSSTSFLTAPI
ncbi:hypothetical protein c7_L512 [Megavirus courdo7]|uniref:Uncharacterized protein n=1 Tax=Megavirus courdo7 TaxID=1128135 RepID=H2EB02_9VIRU|nr:hypothetical protein c7_L512 [Megavirus courdo7]